MLPAQKVHKEGINTIQSLYAFSLSDLQGAYYCLMNGQCNNSEIFLERRATPP